MHYYILLSDESEISGENTIESINKLVCDYGDDVVGYALIN